MKALLLITHGSRSPQSRDEVIALAAVLKERSQVKIVEYCFLDVDRPNIPEGIETCVAKGATHITILLNFLNSGNHVLLDVPGLVKEAQEKYPKLTFKITAPIGQHPQIPDLFLDLI